MPGMPSRQSAAVDTRRDGSLSFAPLDRPVERAQPSPTAHDTTASDRVVISRRPRRRPRLIVEGLRPGAGVASIGSTGGDLGTMSEYPIQVSKVQAPPLREETLARDRLLDWLSVKIHRRVVLLTAEAGYGKTTLLADFSRRTRLRVLWFRLDRGDRDWVGFLAYLVAAVRVHVPDFGPSTSALLRETATTAPTLDTVLDTFLRELGGLSNDPTAMVFDDVHLVDDSPDVRYVLRELLVRGPERMSFVFASRREPPVRLARLRALGEVAELGTDDLRFDAIETERLFRETYEMRLEPAVLTELRRRTEGWAASLQLVRAALHDRDPGQVRAFISSLSGAEGHLYEYLAEEVIGDLPADLQQFLMRTSLLETVDLVLGPVAADVDEAAARHLIEDGERHGLFGRGGPNTRHVVRAHPLVRDFLQARLSRSIGDEGVRGIHLRIARAAESLDWRVAGRHYLASGDTEDAHRVLSAAIENILATGAYAAANDLVTELPTGTLEGAPGLVLRSRLAQQRADVEEGRDLAELAWLAEPHSTAALLNLATARALAGDVVGALEVTSVLERSGHAELAQVARAYQRAVETSIDGSIPLAVRELEELAGSLGRRGDRHYQGVALLNLAYSALATADWTKALASAEQSIALLSATSAGIELVSARLARAVALASQGDIHAARDESALATEGSVPGQALEIAAEIGYLEGLFGEGRLASPLLNRVSADLVPNTDHGEQGLVSRALLRVQEGDLDGARTDTSVLRYGEPRTSVAFEARRHLATGLVLSLLGDPMATDQIRVGTTIARKQGATLWARYGAALEALTDRSVDVSSSLVNVARESPDVLSMLAESVLARLPELNEEATEAVFAEAARRPWRWRVTTRRALESRRGPDRLRIGLLLSSIGEREDIRRLRRADDGVRDRRASKLGLELARRLADRVFVEDLGRVRILAGSRVIEGGEIRRKVLALLCLLASRSRFTSTREEVIDSLWPENDPQSALNSLNQTVYFLRRVFEPDYSDDTSPGYVGQDGETIWLDAELVECRSRRCLDIIRSMPGDPTPEGAVLLATEYTSRFALDFAYEEWAGAHRDSLHAAYLRVMERAIRADLNAGHFDRGTFMAERAAEVDPDAEEIQTALIRLYQLSGAHAAAAEQYAHYERSMRDLGLEPTPFAEV
jgi:LuxR family maltose regulon positive regulatory protein